MMLYNGTSLAFIVSALNNLKHHKSISRLQLPVLENAVMHGQIMASHCNYQMSHHKLKTYTSGLWHWILPNRHMQYFDYFPTLETSIGSKNNTNVPRQMFTKSLELQPGYAPAFNNLGLVFVAEGRLDEAKFCFNKALAADPLLDVAKSNMIKAVAISKMSTGLSTGVLQE